MEGLDLSARTVLQEIVAEQRSAGKTVLVVSHALGEVAQICDRVAVLVAGRLGYLGSLASLLRDPDTGGRALAGSGPGPDLPILTGARHEPWIQFGHAQATDRRYISPSHRFGHRLDDAGGHGNLRRALPERDRFGRQQRHLWGR